MKTLLLFPPVMRNFGPFLGLPSLTAFLREKGYDVDQRDINSELHDFLFTQEAFSQINEEMNVHFNALNNYKTLSIRQQERYLDLISGPVAQLPIYQTMVEDVKTAFRNLENYKIPFDNIQPAIANYWPLLSDIKSLVIPDTDFIFDLPEYSLEYLHKLISGRSKLTYQDQLDALVMEIMHDSKPNVVGISFVVSYQVFPGLLLAYWIKTRFPDVHIIVGGPFWTTVRKDLPGLLPQLDFIDSVGLYEGEHTILGLLKALEDGRDVASVPNIVTASSYRGIRENISVIEDLNELPCPDYDGLKLNTYFTPQPLLSYASARGCYYNRCAFCNFQSPNARFRTRSIEKVVADLARLSNKHGNLFYFSQECEPPPRFEALSDALINNGIKLNYQVFARFDPRFNRTILGKMKTSGCKYIFFGLESASQRINDCMRKGVDLAVARRILSDCHAERQNVVVSSIQGFPGETAKEAASTNAFYNEIRSSYGDKIRIAGGSHLYRLARGSRVDRHPKSYGIRKIFRKAAGELALNYVGYDEFKSLEESSPSNKLAHYRNQMPNILFDEHIVLIISALNDERVLNLSTTISEANKSEKKYNRIQLKNSLLSLSKTVRVLPCKFNLNELQMRSAERKDLAWERFMDKGHTIKQICNEMQQTETPLIKKPCYLIINSETGKLMTLSHRVGSFITECTKPEIFETLRERFVQYGLPNQPKRLKKLLVTLMRAGIIEANSLELKDDCMITKDTKNS